LTVLTKRGILRSMSQLSLFQPPSLTVTELTHYLRALLDQDEVLRDVWVQGEISNFSRPSSGHLYFTLKDSSSALRCVVWRSTAVRLRFGVQNGLAVEAHGAISIYDRDGQYQLYVDSIRPAGEGRLYQEFIRLKSRLEAEGLFDIERKRELPERPGCIGIVTSPTGAALQDMLNTLRNRYPMVEVVLSPCSVQGEAAPDEIVAALDRLCRIAQPDVIIMARGGGSLEDLWAFNDERVVRAVAASPVPVITGVGHETDFTLSDFAADRRAPTPTGAAVEATPDRSDLKSELYGLQSRLASAMQVSVLRRRQELDATLQRLGRVSPTWQIRTERQRLDEWQERCLRAAGHALQLRRAHLTGLHNRLLSLNPAAILQRGYALITRPDGSLVYRTGQVQVGDPLQVRLLDGTLSTRIEKVQADHVPGSNAEAGHGSPTTQNDTR
jgi:exodeoxyribonuclease VII large subunit